MSYEITPYKNLQFSSKVNDQAVLNMLPSWFRDSAKKVPKRYLKIEFDSLLKYARPNESEQMLRVAFWEEYKRAIAANEDTMNLPSIYGGVCDARVFRDMVEKQPIKLAYLLFPTPSLTNSLEDIIQLGTQQMRRLLALPAIDEEGKVNVKHAALQKSIWTEAIKLKNGTTQNININQKSLNVTTTQLHAEPPPMQDVTPQPAQIEGVKEEPLTTEVTEIEPVFSVAELEAAALADLTPPKEVIESSGAYDDEPEV